MFFYSTSGSSDWVERTFLQNYNRTNYVMTKFKIFPITTFLIFSQCNTETVQTIFLIFMYYIKYYLMNFTQKYNFVSFIRYNLMIFTQKHFLIP